PPECSRRGEGPMNAPVAPSQDSTPTPTASLNWTWTPFVLLGLLTIATLGGPIAIFLTIRGGTGDGWPPDRPVEWWTFGLCTGSVVGLMTACLVIGLVRWRRLRKAQSGRVGSPMPGGAGVVR